MCKFIVNEVKKVKTLNSAKTSTEVLTFIPKQNSPLLLQCDRSSQW